MSDKEDGLLRDKRLLFPEALDAIHFDSDAAGNRFQEFLDQLPSQFHDDFYAVMSDIATFAAVQGADIGSAVMQYLMRAGKVTTTRCEQCGKPFMRKRPDKRFCSDTCRVQADRAKNF